MRRSVTLLALSLLFFFPLCAQKLTGVWRGYFYDKKYPSERYRYELQLDESKTGELKGVSYSYKSTSFYGKSGLQGIHLKNQSIILKEISLLELKIANGGQACLMTCYLDYKKTGNLETLEGTYIGINYKDKSDCGFGSVYLEKVPEPTFKKEDFLIKKDSAKKIPPTSKLALPEKSKTSTGIAKNNPLKKPIAPSNKTNQDKQPKDPDLIIPPLKPGDPQWSEAPKTIFPVPRLVKERENPLIKTIITYSPDIKVELYDNGEIDNDTITVYHNNETVINKKKLSYKALTVHVHADEDDTMHEFIVVANNLGEVPPNTALVIITTGGKRYEFPVLSDEKKNAKIIVQYVPKKN